MRRYFESLRPADRSAIGLKAKLENFEFNELKPFACFAFPPPMELQNRRLSGSPLLATAGGGSGNHDYRVPSRAWFVQDDWRAKCLVYREPLLEGHGLNQV